MLPVTQTIPKAMIPVLGRPFIGHLLELLASNGFTHAVLCVGYLGELIERYAGDGSQFGLRVSYSYDGAKPAGTAGALKKALAHLGETFFTIYGDAYLPVDYAAIQRAFLQTTALGLMTIYDVRAMGVQGNVKSDGARIAQYSKQAATADFPYIDYGVEMFRSRAFDSLREDEPADLAFVFGDLIAKKSLCAFEVRQRFYEIGSSEGLAETERYLLTLRR